MTKWLAIAATLVLASLLAGCEHPEGPRNVSIECDGCNDDDLERIKWSVRYMDAAANSPLFHHLLYEAITEGIDLRTDQEFLFAGPYVPCDVAPDSDLREPSFVYGNPDSAYVSAVLISSRPYPLRITNDGGTSVTATNGGNQGYLHGNEMVVHLGLRVFTFDPDHQQNWFDGRFGSNAPAYPVDELAGIILHEMLHTHGFSHGTSSFNECGYDSYDCGSTGGNLHPYPTCRKNSLPEIVEAVMSEVVQLSTGWCTGADGNLWQPPSDDPGSVPINTNRANVPNADCQFEPYQ